MTKHMFAPGVIDASPTRFERRTLARRWTVRVVAVMGVMAFIAWKYL
ncbi:hypothetical protein [Limnohabitans sp.]|jgi:hypothetical protein|nr:hypothetical protein [Limnohabitans sp.]